MDWLALLAVQGTLESLLQHPSSRASILLCSAFFIVQLSHPCMTTGKVTSMLFNMLSRFVIAFLPRKCLLVVFFFFFSFGHIHCMAFRILVPRPGITLMPSILTGRFLTNGPSGRSSHSFIFTFIFNWEIIALQNCVDFCHTTI